MSAGFGPMAGMELGGELCRLGFELDLDDDQRDAIDAVMEERRGEFRALHDGFESGDLSAEQLRDQSKALRRSVEEELGQILSEEQSSRLVELRTERRSERAERREERTDEHVERRAELLATALELDDATSAKVRAALETSESEQRAVRAQLRDGEIEIEDARYQGYVITQETSAGIAAALDGDQSRKFEALHRLTPGGGRRGR